MRDVKSWYNLTWKEPTAQTRCRGEHPREGGRMIPLSRPSLVLRMPPSFQGHQGPLLWEDPRPQGPLGQQDQPRPRLHHQGLELTRPRSCRREATQRRSSTSVATRASGCARCNISESDKWKACSEKCTERSGITSVERHLQVLVRVR